MKVETTRSSKMLVGIDQTWRPIIQYWFYLHYSSVRLNRDLNLVFLLLSLLPLSLLLVSLRVHRGVFFFEKHKIVLAILMTFRYKNYVVNTSAYSRGFCLRFWLRYQLSWSIYPFVSSVLPGICWNCTSTSVSATTAFLYISSIYSFTNPEL